jgi:inner membrane protein
LPSVISHAIAGAAIASCAIKPGTPKTLVVVAAVCAAVPDLDVIGFQFGIHYGDFWGHRGFTHSIVFAGLLAGAITLVWVRSGFRTVSVPVLFGVLFLATASHGLLDALTDGGLGAALLSPLNTARYFFPWRPIRVSPIGIAYFFSYRGWMALKSELLWVWVPSGLMAMVGRIFYL